MSQSKTIRPRIWFVDVVRLIASFQMINGHTLDVLLMDAVRHGVIFERYTWARGLTSVAFLSVAGIAFHLATLARFEAHRASKDEVKKRFRRAGVLFLLGYFLRFPGAAFGDDPVAAAQAWNDFFEVGVLQAIGVSLFLLELATVIAKRPSQVVWFAGVSGGAIVGLAPFFHHAPLEGALYPFTSYLTHAGGSQFPIFPWSGFMLLGTVVGWLTMPDGGRTATRVAVPRLGLVTGTLVVLYFALDAVGSIGPADAHHSTDPAFSAQRFAAVIAIVTVLGVVCARIRTLPRLLRILSAETLFVYVFHLWVLYASVLGIHERWGRTLPLWQALCASAAMMALTVSATVAWHHRKKILGALRDRVRGPRASQPFGR